MLDRAVFFFALFEIAQHSMKGRGRRKGGARQKALVAARAAAARADGHRSSLAEVLISLWCWGSISPQMVQKLAAAARRDMVQARKDTMDCVMDQVWLYVPDELVGSVCIDESTSGLSQVDKLS
eukprot:1936342-Pyramimonas_sp.AAC.1